MPTLIGSESPAHLASRRVLHQCAEFDSYRSLIAALDPCRACSRPEHCRDPEDDAALHLGAMMGSMCSTSPILSSGLAWAAPQQAADPQLCLHSGPFQNLEIFDCLMSLPPEWRWRSLWIDHLLATRCPRLLSWPFNRHRETWRNALALGEKVLSPDRIRRRVRRWRVD